MIPKLEDYKKRWRIESEQQIKPGLDAVTSALQLLGNPHLELKVIHVTGTNGKGSTVFMMEKILQAHHYSTAIFTSPAVIDLHDQIKINGENATAAQINAAFEKIQAAGLSGKLTDFELLTVVAFLVFHNESPEYVIIETGMGGLLDSTNVVQPLVSIITSIALDHTQFLGETLAEIATHKAGIIKKQTPVVVGELPPEALAVVENKAVEQDASLNRYNIEFNITENPTQFVGTKIFPIPTIKMKGQHQKSNCALAIEALYCANVSLEVAKIVDALASAQYPNRFQEISPNVYIDGAHNPAAAKALCQTIRQEFPGETVDFVVGMLKTKDIEGTLNELIPVAHSFTFIHFDHKDAASVETLLKLCSFENKHVTILKGGSIVLLNANQKKKIVTGSLYLLSGLKDVIVE